MNQDMPGLLWYQKSITGVFAIELFLTETNNVLTKSLASWGTSSLIQCILSRFCHHHLFQQLHKAMEASGQVIIAHRINWIIKDELVTQNCVLSWLYWLYYDSHLQLGTRRIPGGFFVLWNLLISAILVLCDIYFNFVKSTSGNNIAAKWLFKIFPYDALIKWWEDSELLLVSCCNCPTTSLCAVMWYILCMIKFINKNL